MYHPVLRDAKGKELTLDLKGVEVGGKTRRYLEANRPPRSDNLKHVTLYDHLLDVYTRQNGDGKVSLSPKQQGYMDEIKRLHDKEFSQLFTVEERLDGTGDGNTAWYLEVVPFHIANAVRTGGRLFSITRLLDGRNFTVPLDPRHAVKLTGYDDNVWYLSLEERVA